MLINITIIKCGVSYSTRNNSGIFILCHKKPENNQEFCWSNFSGQLMYMYVCMYWCLSNHRGKQRSILWVAFFMIKSTFMHSFFRMFYANNCKDGNFRKILFLQLVCRYFFKIQKKVFYKFLISIRCNGDALEKTKNIIKYL